jgi:hypothetical protein
MTADRNEIGQWVPRLASAEHVLYDELVLGHVERLTDDGPCYAWIGETRLGPFTSDTAAREAVMDRAFAAAIKRYEARIR